MTISTIALAAALLLALGYLVLGVLILLPSTSRIARPLLPILNTEIVIAVAFIVPFLLPPAARLPLLLGFGVRVLWEAASVAVLRRGQRDGLLTVMLAGSAAATLVAVVWISLDPIQSTIALVVVVSTLLLALLVIGKNQSIARLASEVALFPGLPLGLTVAAAMVDAKAVLLLTVFILVETFDSYALLGGKLFGRHKAFPRLSPNKTIEGLAFGAGMLWLTALALALVTGLATPSQASAAALGAGCATVAGDLLASRLKRASDVKDYPAVMRLQGGVLDIADAAIIAAAVVALIPL